MRRKVMEQIEEWDMSGRPSCLMIRGARQVGKTYAVEAYCAERGRHVLSIDLSKDRRAHSAFSGNLTVDDIVLRLSAIYPGFEFVPGGTLLFLDEIQACPDARTALKSFVTDSRRRYRVIASGSLLGLSVSEIGLPSTGSVESLDMGPMDFEEFLWALGVTDRVIEVARSSISACEPMDQSLFETLSEYHRWYMVVGGMPEAVREFVDSRQFGPVRRVQRKLIDGYMEDIKRFGEGGEVPRIESCFRSIPGMLAAENKRFMFKDIEPDDAGDQRGYRTGYQHYAAALEWLSMARLTLMCRKVSEMHMPLRERTSGNMFKIYMLDTGLLLSLYDPELIGEIIRGSTGVNSGALAENAVAVALSLRGRGLYYYHDGKTRTELDFVIVVDGRVCAVEVKSGSNRACPSLNRAVKDMGLGGIMFETRNCFVDDKGVRHYPLFAASFIDDIDHSVPPTFDFGSVDRINARFGGPGGRRFF